MTIITTLDVFCDYPQCHEGVHGTVGVRPNLNHARLFAKENGWEKRQYDDKIIDLCPEHRKIKNVVPK